MEIVSETRMFGGRQLTIAHESAATGTTMRCGPNEGPSVHTVWACPSASDVAVVGSTEPAPVSGVKVTSMFGTGWPRASCTRATTGSANASPAIASWPPRSVCS